MSKKTIIIFIIVVIVVGIVLGVFAFATKRGASPSELGRDVFGRFFPSDDTRDISLPDDSGLSPTQDETLSGEVIPLPALRQLTKNAVSGAYVFEREGESVIRFIERESGHLFEIGEGDTLVTRITNTTIPRVQRVVWIDEETLILQYLDARSDTIKSFLATVSPPEEDKTDGELALVGNFLPQNALSLTSSPTGQSVFYFLEENTPGGFIATLGGGGEVGKRVFDLPVTEWKVEWPKGNILTLTRKASAFSAGSLYFLNTLTENFEQVLGNKVGLTTHVRPDRKEVLYSKSTTGGILFGVANVNSGEEHELALQTLPEKCAWSETSSNIIYCGVPVEIPSSVYPDAWYQGLISFSDNIWSIDTSSGISNLLARPLAEARQTIDIIKPKLSPSENLLIFLNKNDHTLWSLELTDIEETSI